MRDILRFLLVGSMSLILLCCGPPSEKDPTEQTPDVPNNPKSLEKKIEEEAKKVAKILHKTRAKLQNTANKIEKNQSNKKWIQIRNIYKEDENLPKVNDIVKLQKETLTSVQNDLLYQALSILEDVKSTK